MSKLICNLPAVEVWIRKEYLRDGKDGHGKFVKGIWVSCKSLPGRAFYFETYLPEYGALFDKLPISAFCSSPETPALLVHQGPQQEHRAASHQCRAPTSDVPPEADGNGRPHWRG